MFRYELKDTGVFFLPPPSPKMSKPTSVDSIVTCREIFVPCMNFVSRYSVLIVKYYITNVKLYFNVAYTHCGLIS